MRPGVRISLVGIVAVLVLSVAGCIDLDTRVELDGSGGGTVTLSYRLDVRLLDLGTFDGPTDEPAIPISRRDFDLLLTAVDGARLRDHSVRREGGIADVTARIEFESVDAFNALFGPGALSVRDDSIELQLVDGAGAREIDEELIAEFFDGRRLRFFVETPSTIAEINRGSIVDGGRSAELTVPLADAVLSRDAIRWVISR
jgi:hypothetical protein